MYSGRFLGTWSGHLLTFVKDGKRINFTTTFGVRGINVPVTFQIVNGVLDEDSIRTLKEF
jgi:hypothetical protein